MLNQEINLQNALLIKINLSNAILKNSRSNEKLRFHEEQPHQFNIINILLL